MTLAGFVAPLPVGLDGWTNPNETWTFGSSTTINVPNGALYQKGDKLKLTQSSTVKYFYVISIAANVLTVVSQDANVTTTVANSAITLNYYSRAASPLGFPLCTWTPGYTGFSANPTPGTCNFSIQGNICTITYNHSGVGTSNATGFTITGLPVTTAAGATAYGPLNGMDNTVSISTIDFNLAGTTMTLEKTVAAGAATWTASGSKALFSCSFSYPF